MNSISKDGDQPARDEAYDLIDRFLRNNLDDIDYADFSAALEVLYTRAALSPKSSMGTEPSDANWPLLPVACRYLSNEPVERFGGSVVAYYTAEQMRAYARSAVLALAAPAVQAEPSGDVIALAEKCSAEVGRHEGRAVWVKFHSQASLDAFATGIVMSATVKRHKPPAAQSADVDATLSDKAVLSILRTYEARIKELTAAAVNPGEVAYQLTKRLVIDMPTARAAVDAALSQSAAHPEGGDA